MGVGVGVEWRFAGFVWISCGSEAGVGVSVGVSMGVSVGVSAGAVWDCGNGVYLAGSVSVAWIKGVKEKGEFRQAQARISHCAAGCARFAHAKKQFGPKVQKRSLNYQIKILQQWVEKAKSERKRENEMREMREMR